MTMGSDIVVHPQNGEAGAHASWTAPRGDWGDADGMYVARGRDQTRARVTKGRTGSGRRGILAR